MKFILSLLLSFISLSAFADWATYECAVSKLDRSNPGWLHYVQIDRLLVGATGVSFVSELARPIKTLSGIGMSVSVGGGPADLLHIDVALPGLGNSYLFPKELFARIEASAKVSGLS